MQDFKAIQERARTVSKEVDELLVKVDEHRAKTKALYESAGIQSDDVASYLQSTQLGPDECRQVEQELVEFRASTEQEIRHAVEQAKSQQSANRVRIAPARMRI